MREWINVNEKLPNTDGRFEVTIRGRDKMEVEMENYSVESQMWGSKWNTKNVVAWRERAEPYRG